MASDGKNDRNDAETICEAACEAFRAAERQLQSFKIRPPQDPTSPSGSALTGQVAQVLPDADHGFILNNVGSQLYFTGTASPTATSMQ
jgi:hypothetical protein